jgi:AraC-like DNA-binding protein
MAGGDPLTGMVPVQRVEVATRHMDAVAELICQLFVEHRALFRCPDPSRAEAEVRTATAGPLSAAQFHWGGVEYRVAEAAPAGGLFGMVVRRGSGVVTTRREELHYSSGDVYLAPPSDPYEGVLGDTEFAVLQIPWHAARDLAEEKTGLPASELRFLGMGPVSAARRRLLASTVEFISGQLVTSGAAEVPALVAQEMTSLAAAAFLETFPNSSMTVPYLPGPGWVAPATVRRAVAFIDAHAGQPVTTADIAAVAGVTIRALQYAFRRHYDTTPTGYLRRVRLEHARLDLDNAAPGDGVTVAAVARKWGWASQAQFAAAYQQRFGMPPAAACAPDGA